MESTAIALKSRHPDSAPKADYGTVERVATGDVLRPSKVVITNQMWLVLAVSYVGWLLDQVDATIYAVVQSPALEELMGTTDKASIVSAGSCIMVSTMVGMASGGIIAGYLSDIFGRVKMMMVTVLIYSVCTALCGFARSWQELCILRFLTGIGTGGEWACGANLVAEVWPDSMRHFVGPILQSASGAGYLVSGLVYYFASPLGWRFCFFLGLIPAGLTFVMRMFVEESEMFKASHIEGPDSKEEHERNRLSEVVFGKFAQDTWMATLVVFTSQWLAWTVGAWLSTITRDIVRDFPQASWQHVSENDISSGVIICYNIGAIFGALSWIYLANYAGRKGGFSLFMVLNVVAIPAYFRMCHTVEGMITFAPVLGFCFGGMFGGVPVYLPELFPTKYRGTGSSFIYNFSRLMASWGQICMLFVVNKTGNYYDAAAMMPLMILTGLFALLFSRETRGVKLE